MAIITKPTTIERGQAYSFTLNKADLITAVSGDTYFENSSNWFKVLVSYKSDTNSQYEVVEFNGQDATPTGEFLVSANSEGNFQVSYVQIIDFDGGTKTLLRADLNTSEFDVSFAGENLNFINYDITNGPVADEFGGVTAESPYNTYQYFVKSSTGYSGDFQISYEVDLSSINELGLGISTSLSSTAGDFTNTFFIVYFLSQTKFSSFSNGTLDASWQPVVEYSESQVTTITFTRVGTDLTITIPGIEPRVIPFSGTVYPFVRPYLSDLLRSWDDQGV